MGTPRFGGGFLSFGGEGMSILLILLVVVVVILLINSRG